MLAWTTLSRIGTVQPNTMPLGCVDHLVHASDQTSEQLEQPVAVQTEAEKAAILQHLQHKFHDVLFSTCHRPSYRGLASRVFAACKLGPGVPVALQNMAFCTGNKKVYYKSPSGATANMPQGGMAQTMLVWMLDVMRDLFDDLFLSMPDKEDLLMESWDALYGPKYQDSTASFRDAAQAYSDKVGVFETYDSGLQAIIRDEARRIASMLESLPPYSKKHALW